MICHLGQQCINKQGRWFKAGVFEEIVDDHIALLRVAEGRNEQPGRGDYRQPSLAIDS